MDGTVAATALGLFIRLPAGRAEEMKAELDFWEVVPDEASETNEHVR